MFRLRFLTIFTALAAAIVLLAADAADARVGGGRSFGSRGVRTFTPPAATRTAPTAQPMQRTVTQPGTTGQASTAGGAARPGTGGLFNRPGLIGGLAAGFLGAGLLGLLFGHGLLGGLGGFASILGLLLQVGLVVIVARLAWNWWQRRNAPAYAGMPRNAVPGGDPAHPRGALGGLGLGGATAAAPDTLEITKDDYDTFEVLLSEMQAAYSTEDLAQLRARATAEMVSYFAEDFAANASRGVINTISGVKLLQGDLSEAWREGETDYATVAMRFELNDRMVDRTTGRVVEGDDESVEATELWTFRRDRGGQWIVSAIQQV